MSKENAYKSNETQMPALSITNFRMTLDMYINSIIFIRPSREVSLAYTHLQRGFMWLGKAQGAAGGENPYKQSLNPKSTTIEPTADHSPTSLMNVLWDMEGYGTHTARVKSLRSLLAEHNKKFKEFSSLEHTFGPDYGMYLLESRKAIEEASMWLGWELARVKKEQENPKSDGVSSMHPSSNLPL